jgi:hypothetical protein
MRQLNILLLPLILVDKFLSNQHCTLVMVHLKSIFSECALLLAPKLPVRRTLTRSRLQLRRPRLTQSVWQHGHSRHAHATATANAKNNNTKGKHIHSVSFATSTASTIKYCTWNVFSFYP